MELCNPPQTQSPLSTFIASCLASTLHDFAEGRAYFLESRCLIHSNNGIMIHVCLINLPLVLKSSLSFISLYFSLSFIFLSSPNFLLATLCLSSFVQMEAWTFGQKKHNCHFTNAYKLSTNFVVVQKHLEKKKKKSSLCFLSVFLSLSFYTSHNF